MKICLKCFVSICLFMLTTLTHAAAVNDFATLLNSIQTMRADFTQTVFNNRGKAIQQSHGRMAMQRPGRFRWDVIKPIPQLVVANQSRLWIYDADLEQVTIRSIKQAAGETPALLLSHVNTNTALGKDFAVTFENKNQSNWRWFKLVPKKPDSMFAVIEMGFLNGQIHEMRLQDHLGHTTTIQFNHAEINISLPASLFVFKPTANVDVIDETKSR